MKYSKLEIMDALSELSIGKTVAEIARETGISYQVLLRASKKLLHATTRRKPREDRPFSKEEVLDIRRRALDGIPMDNIAMVYSVTTQTAKNIAEGMTYCDIPGTVYGGRVLIDVNQCFIDDKKSMKKVRNILISFCMSEMGWSKYLASKCVDNWNGVYEINDDFMEYMLYTFKPYRRAK